MNDLTPCVYCGESKAYTLSEADPVHPGHFRANALCPECGARGPLAQKYLDVETAHQVAAQAWNTRAADRRKMAAAVSGMEGI